MKTIVISQPMFFPWRGIFEQIKIADCFVHYPDVALPQGRSFSNRVQVKGAQGIKWLTAPLKKRNGNLILDAHFDNTQNWRDKHLKILSHFYAKALFKNDMLDIVNDAFNDFDQDNLAAFNIASIEKISEYIGLDTEFQTSQGLYSDFFSTERLVALVNHFSGDSYVTGWGAKNYLDLSIFADISVHLMDYTLTEYRQLHGQFTPYVSILDLIANEGPDSNHFLEPRTISWDDYLKRKENT